MTEHGGTLAQPDGIPYLAGMGWDSILGHEREVEKLRYGCAAGRLAHAYAFVGTAGIGKYRFARYFAQCLLCERHTDAELQACGECPSCQQVQAHTHPDLLVVQLPEDKRELPIRLFIGEDESRGKEGLCYDISRKPMSARRRVAIIDSAETMNEESSNALLKTLEEPPPNSVMILVASSADALLSTIRSRCQILVFQPLSTELVRELMVQEGLTTNVGEAAQVAPFCDGSLQIARQLLDPQIRALRNELFNLLAAHPFLSVQTAERMIECLEPAGAEKRSQREYAGWIVRFCVEFYRRALLTVAGAPAHQVGDVPQVRAFVQRLGIVTYTTIDALTELLERSLAAEIHLSANTGIALCFETFFDDIGKILRQPTA
ncbi:MAG: DNA polymerase III subunit delta' [Planctomycetes bacterium]|nr:DNA polymerase III subunit delta' [Planctomycetota bacterium]